GALHDHAGVRGRKLLTGEVDQGGEPRLDELEVLGRVVDAGVDRTGEQGGRAVGVRADRDDVHVLVRIDPRRLQGRTGRDIAGAPGVGHADLRLGVLPLEVREARDALLDVKLVRIDRGEVRDDHEVSAAGVRAQSLRAAELPDLDAARKERGARLRAAVDRLQVYI